jgi:hypothetical protein
VWIGSRPRIRDWWGRAQEWPAYKTGLVDLITPAEIDEMRKHGPSIRDQIATHRAGLSL